MESVLDGVKFTIKEDRIPVSLETRAISLIVSIDFGHALGWDTESISDFDRAVNSFDSDRQKYLASGSDMQPIINSSTDYIIKSIIPMQSDALKHMISTIMDELNIDSGYLDLLYNIITSRENITDAVSKFLMSDKDTISRYKDIDVVKNALTDFIRDINDEINKPTNDDMKADNVIDINFPAMLAKYDMAAIDSSIIQYYQAIQQLTDELMDKLDNCEQKMAPLIRDFNQISLRLSKKYEDNPHLTDKENALLSERQLYFQKKFSLGLSNAKSKILAVRKQADSLESRIDEIDNGDDSIHELALLEKEERASFSFVAENMAKIIKNALQKMDYFQNNRQFITNVIGLWETWSEDYRIFKTTYREDLKATCEEDGIEEDIWEKWYVDWQNIRFAIEQKLKPMIERGLKAPVPAVTETEVSIPEQSIRILNDYKHMVDTFFIEDRKGIYQKFAFQPGGEMQDKFETENELYKYTVSLQGALQEVIFNCENAEDRVFILTWANSLLDIQIDGILDFIADKDLKQLSETLLSEFAALKQKNYDTYLTDAQAYSKERSRREKEYNSLVFKMRKDLMKEWTKR